MHSLIASSSPKEVGSNGVPSPQVATSRQIRFTITVSSPTGRSISAKVVAMDVVDMLVGEDYKSQLMQGGGKGPRCETQKNPLAYKWNH